MKVKELQELFSKVDPEADIITFNRTSNRWIPTSNIENYQIKTVADIYENCGQYAQKQLDKFNKNDITFFF